MYDDDDDDEACEGPALGPLGTAIVATVAGGLILMAITRVLLPRVVVRQPAHPQDI